MRRVDWYSYYLYESNFNLTYENGIHTLSNLLLQLRIGRFSFRGRHLDFFPFVLMQQLNFSIPRKVIAHKAVAHSSQHVRKRLKSMRKGWCCGVVEMKEGNLRVKALARLGERSCRQHLMTGFGVPAAGKGAKLAGLASMDDRRRG
jgi:hypothetical protein